MTLHHSSIAIGALLTAALVMSSLSSCHRDTLEDRAEKETREYTERYCPTPVKDFQRTDSITFDRTTHTFSYYFTLCDAADNAEVLDSLKPKLRKALVDEIKNNVTSKAYKEKGYSYHYVFRSEKSGSVLYEEKLTKKDYQIAEQ